MVRKEVIEEDQGPPKVPQKCGCGIIFAADMEGKLIVDGFVHGGSAETSRIIQKGKTLIVSSIYIASADLSSTGDVLRLIDGNGRWTACLFCVFCA